MMSIVEMEYQRVLISYIQGASSCKEIALVRGHVFVQCVRRLTVLVRAYGIQITESVMGIWMDTYDYIIFFWYVT